MAPHPKSNDARPHPIARKQPTSIEHHDYLLLTLADAKNAHAIQNVKIMQVLWSRAAQARSACRCRSCLHAATTVARRSTTAATRRGLKVGDIFTAFYSTILATAAFADSKAKETRTKEWDRVIAEARDGKPLHEIRIPGFAGRDDATEITTGSANSSPFTNDVLKELQTEKESMRITYTRSSSGLKTNLEDRLDNLRSQLGDHSEALSQDSSKNSFIEEKDDPGLPFVEPQNQDDLSYLENCMAVLVQKLLARLISSSSAQRLVNASNTDTQSRFQDVMTNFNTLTTNFTRLPIYSYHNLQAVQQERSNFLQALDSVFQKSDTSQQSIDLLLAKICYNLLVSTTPPSTKTYNLLLSEFSRLRRHDIAQDILDAFYESKLRPTRLTLELIVRHYTATRDRRGLERVNKMIRGLEGDMLISISSNKGTRSLPTVRNWAADPKNKVISWGGKLTSRPPRDKKVLDSLTRGQLELRGVRSAIRMLRLTLREKRSVKSHTLVDTIQSCIAQADFTAGISLLLAILSPWITNTQGLASIPISFNRHVRHAIYQLLWFVGVDPSRGSSGYLIQPLKSKSKFHPQQTKLPCHALDQMLKHMHYISLCELSKSLDEVTAITSQLLREMRSFHKSSNPDLATISSLTVDTALSFLDRSKRMILKRIVKTDARQTGNSLRLKALESSLVEKEEKNECIGLELELIESINKNEVKIENIIDRLAPLEDIGVSQERVDCLEYLSWVFARQLMALSLQFGWMDIDTKFQWRSPVAFKAWKRRLLVNYDKRLGSVAQAYSEYHREQLIAAGQKPVQLELKFPVRPWLTNPSFTRDWKSVDLSVSEEPVEKFKYSPALARAQVSAGRREAEKWPAPKLSIIHWADMGSHRSSYASAFG